MSKEGARRRNNALRKIRRSRHLTLEIKEAIQVVIDLLNYQSGYNVAWPSAKTIASKMGRSPRSGKAYVRIIKALGIFSVYSMTPENAVAFCKQNFGIRPKLERCGGQAPNLFVVNDHCLWNSQKELPEDLDRKMGETAQSIKAKRNAKTTSSLASDPTRRPKYRKYSLNKIRESLQETLELMRDDVANEDVEYDQDELQWCREEMLNGVANDTTDDVANDTQVFKHSSCEVDFVSPPPEARLEKAATVLSVIPSPKGSAVRQPCSQGLRAATAPPTRRLRRDESRKKHPGILEGGGLMAIAGSDCRSAPYGTVPVRHEMPEQGVGRIDGELLASVERLESERREKEQRLTSAYADRLDGDDLDSLSLALRGPFFSSGKHLGRD